MASMAPRVTSSPVMSIVSKGPMRRPIPSRMPLSTSSGVTTPASTRRMASTVLGRLMRLRAKPATSRFTVIVSLPRLSTKAFAAASVSSEVSRPRTSSHRGMSGTGLKKCAPTTRSGRSVTLASSVIGMAEVLLARMARGGQRRSSSRKTSCFNALSSKTASTAKSASAAASSARVGLSLPSADSRASAANCPFSTNLPSDQAMLDMALSSIC